MVHVRPRPPGFTTTLHYVPVSTKGKGRLFRLESDLVFTSGGVTIRVPKGFVYDRASIPRLARKLFPPELMDYAAAVHDWLYWVGFDKRVADSMMWMISRAEGKMGRARSFLVWAGVSLGGWPSWWRHKRRIRKARREKRVREWVNPDETLPAEGEE